MHTSHSTHTLAEGSTLAQYTTWQLFVHVHRVAAAAVVGLHAVVAICLLHYECTLAIVMHIATCKLMVTKCTVVSCLKYSRILPCAVHVMFVQLE
jgi:hypothetical protein